MKCIDEKQRYDRVLELYNQLEEAKKMKVNNLASSHRICCELLWYF